MSLAVVRKPLMLVITVLVGLAPLLAAADGAQADRTNAVRQAIRDGSAEHVIVLIGDGLGDSEITIARNYQVGAAGRLAMDQLPLTGDMTTYAVQESNPALPEYVTDSAASGTGFATGFKTSNGRISTTPGNDRDVQTILELAQRAGLRTGDVSTAELTDATPAVQAAHVVNRSCQGPANMALCPQDKKSAGGPGSIAEQMVDHGVDVLLGGGKQRFDQVIDGGPDAGKTVTQSAARQGYTVVADAAGLNAIRPGQKVLGLFNSGNMSVEWAGLPATAGTGSGPQRCTEGQRPQNEPSLAAMTSKALELLDQGNSKGFFLQVEGASIDKQEHVSNPCGQLGETVAFDAAVRVALDFAKREPRTLVIVTGDHGHTSQIIPVDAVSPGLSSTVITKDGANMKLNYATNTAGQEHTGTQVHIAAQGPQAANVVGVMDATNLFSIIKRALRLD